MWAYVMDNKQVLLTPHFQLLYALETILEGEEKGELMGEATILVPDFLFFQVFKNAFTCRSRNQSNKYKFTRSHFFIFQLQTLLSYRQ